MFDQITIKRIPRWTHYVRIVDNVDMYTYVDHRRIIIK